MILQLACYYLLGIEIMIKTITLILIIIHTEWFQILRLVNIMLVFYMQDMEI